MHVAQINCWEVLVLHTTIRVFFSKKDRAKYISHLDSMRMFTRSIRRTNIPVWYTEGFNPRLYMTFPLPLSLGYESNCESFDMRLVDADYPLDQVKEQLNKVLPMGVTIVSVTNPVMKPDEIALADYQIDFESDEPFAFEEKLNHFADQDEIIVTKKTKKGEKQIDIKPLVTMQRIEIQNFGCSVWIRTAAGTTLNVSPSLWIEAFEKTENIPNMSASVKRLAILTQDAKEWI